MKYFEIVSINISGQKGEIKKPVGRAVLKKEFGIIGDAHAGQTHRQVSLLASEDITVMQVKGAQVNYGDFAENITTRGIDLAAQPIGAQIKIGTALLEITQIGKVCHTGCAIRRQVGECIMPTRGVFAKVLKGSEISNESAGSYDF